MKQPTTNGPNADQIEFWSGRVGEKWVEYQPRLDAMMASITRALVEAAEPTAGERVLDVGCGCGDLAFEVARRVRPGGAVTGIDVSEVMLAHARTLAAAQGLTITYEHADAETHAFPASAHDLMVSRFGVMFFRNPGRAFANIARALRPDARLAFACWQARELNPWLRLPWDAAARHVAFDELAGEEEPGPHSLARRGRVEAILAEAGLTDVCLTSLELALNVGATRKLEDAVDFVLNVGPVARALAEAEPGPRARAVSDIREAFAKHHGDRGVELGAAVWLVTARRP
ncbi:MAG: class I SAM-dependent methyltransferase [Alphaproteobacteria bacterium]